MLTHSVGDARNAGTFKIHQNPGEVASGAALDRSDDGRAFARRRIAKNELILDIRSKGICRREDTGRPEIGKPVLPTKRNGERSNEPYRRAGR